jgi:hypothetical protein
VTGFGYFAGGSDVNITIWLSHKRLQPVLTIKHLRGISSTEPAHFELKGRNDGKLPPPLSIQWAIMQRIISTPTRMGSGIHRCTPHPTTSTIRWSLNLHFDRLVGWWDKPT